MDERTVLPTWQGSGTDTNGEGAPAVVHRYRLGLETAVAVRAAGGAWWCTPERSAGGSVAAEEWRPAGEGDGAAQAFVDLVRFQELPPVPGFRMVRLNPPPEAIGERAVDAGVDPEGGAQATVVVGERIAVAWSRHAVDGPHPGATTLRHLAALEFMGVPEIYGLLLWSTPGGHEVPVAIATKYLPRSRDGWAWAHDLVEAAAGLATPPAPTATPPGGIDLSSVDLPARLGRHVAKLHLALATPSPVDAEPARRADVAAVLGWLAETRADLDAAAKALPDGAGDLHAARDLPAMRAAVDRLELVAAAVEAGRRSVVVQRVHGDLHIGRVLRWTRGLAVVGFDAAPPVPWSGRAYEPAARDLARLLASLGEVARRAAARPGMPPDVPAAWYARAREDVLVAYRAALAAAERPDLLDDDLLAAFEAAERARWLLASAAAAAASDATSAPTR